MPETEQAFVQQSHEGFETPAAKRQKILGKQMPPPFYQQEQFHIERKEFLKIMIQNAPKVGKRTFLSGDLIIKAGTLFPQIQIKGIEVCKGADRYRSPMEGITRRNATRRFSMGVHRNQEGHFCDDAWEDWTGLTRKSLTRKCPPSTTAGDALWPSQEHGFEVYAGKCDS